MWWSEAHRQFKGSFCRSCQTVVRFPSLLKCPGAEHWLTAVLTVTSDLWAGGQVQDQRSPSSKLFHVAEFKLCCIPLIPPSESPPWKKCSICSVILSLRGFCLLTSDPRTCRERSVLSEGSHTVLDWFPVLVWTWLCVFVLMFDTFLSRCLMNRSLLDYYWLDCYTDQRRGSELVCSRLSTLGFGFDGFFLRVHTFRYTEANVFIFTTATFFGSWEERSLSSCLGPQVTVILKSINPLICRLVHISV